MKVVRILKLNEIEKFVKKIYKYQTLSVQSKKKLYKENQCLLIDKKIKIEDMRFYNALFCVAKRDFDP